MPCLQRRKVRKEEKAQLQNNSDLFGVFSPKFRNEFFNFFGPIFCFSCHFPVIQPNFQQLNAISVCICARGKIGGKPALA
jgi:hypothetical protein